MPKQKTPHSKTSPDLTTEYLGMTLKNPLIASASPLSYTLSNARKLEEAGISAIVLFSLFEEQIIHETHTLHDHFTRGTDSYPEALTYFPEPSQFILGPDEYLNHIEKLKKEIKVPIIGSINGYSLGGWTKYAKKIENAGADALELNIYFIPTDPHVPGSDVEQKYIDILHSVKSSISIPVAIKLSPFFSNMANMAKRLEETGADGLVLFNRFYQPDIDLANLEVTPNILLSTPQAMRLPLRWIAILHGRIKCSLSATSGVHTHEDVLKLLMVGADATMLCSTLLKNGISRVSEILGKMKDWMIENEYQSVSQMKGSMSQKSCPNPELFERGNYVKALDDYGKMLYIKSLKE
ncbi:MAG: dihydroorotate dehydrogenase-like protein [Candidatus Omnitrophota bacterium]|nr:dihydroorotate dehydrogenase-like protein [Candidatus Omnitrophota bacterium]